MSYHTYTRDPETGRWEAAPVCGEGIQRDLDHQAALRAKDEAIYARVNGTPRSYEAEGDVICNACTNGLIAENVGGWMRSFDCPQCAGTGWRK